MTGGHKNEKNNEKSTGEKKVQFVIGLKKNIDDTELQSDLKKLDNVLKNVDNVLNDIDNSLKKM